MLRSLRAGSIFAHARSAAPTVIGLHGWGRSHRDLDAIVDPLDGMALDLPGFGASPAPLVPWGARDYAIAVAEVIDELDVRPVVLGHSFGGRIAVCLAAERPDLVSGLVLTGVPLLRSERRPRPAVAYRVAKRLNALGIVRDQRMEQQRQRFGSTDYRNTTGIMRSVLVKVVNEDYSDELRQLDCRVELVWGEVDEAAPLAIALAAHEMLANSSLTVLDGVGHDTPSESPAELRAAVARLLD